MRSQENVRHSLTYFNFNFNFKFVLRHSKRFTLEAYHDAGVGPLELVDDIFGFSLNDIDLVLEPERPIDAITIAWEKTASDSPTKQRLEQNSRPILDLLDSIGQIDQSWAFTGSDGTHGALFTQADWTSVFRPHPFRAAKTESKVGV